MVDSNAKAIPAEDEPRPDFFARGVRACADMLEGMTDVEDHVIDSQFREEPQVNAVRVMLNAIMAHGNAAELDGFCAALTEIVAFADSGGDWCHGFSRFADRWTYLSKVCDPQPATEVGL